MTPAAVTPTRDRLVRRLAGAALATALLAGCTSSTRTVGPAPSPAVTGTTTIVRTSPAAPDTFVPPPARTVAPLPPGRTPPRGEVARACPYIRSGTGAVYRVVKDPNVADLEGNRVGRTTVLTTRRPVGCRFYFAYGDYHPVADIVPTTFATAAQAHNALVRTAAAGRTLESYPHFVPGVDGIGYQTRFAGPDGDHDWAFAFAKGRVLVVVRTNQDNIALSASARLLAAAVVGKF